MLAFREILGAALIIAIIMAYLTRTKGNSLHHKGVSGSILAVMFGYTVRAEWARVIVHLAYIAIALPLVILVYRKPIEGEE